MSARIEREFQHRLQTLCDGRSGLRAALTVQAKAEDNAPVIEFTASDETIDRYDEVIEARGWDLENYRRNPVFQNSHKYGDIVFTLGRSLLTEVRGNRLVQRIEFARDINPVADLAYKLYRGGFLNAVSVGFIPLEWEQGGGQKPYSKKFLKQELLELSAVSIPANPNALQNAVKAGAVEKADLNDLADFIQKFCGSESKPASRVSPLRTAAGDAELFQLARAAQAALRL